MGDEDKFNVTIIGVVFDTGTKKILVGKAKGDKDWSFLESDLTYGEELDIALKKSAKEKTGFIIKNLGAIYAKNCLQKKDRLKLYFLCEIAKGEENKGENIEELKWIKPSEVEAHLNAVLPTRLKGYLMNLE